MRIRLRLCDPCFLKAVVAGYDLDLARGDSRLTQTRSTACSVCSKIGDPRLYFTKVRPENG